MDAAAPRTATALAGELAALAARLCPSPCATAPDTLEVLSERHDRLVVRRRGVVLKAHPPGTEPEGLSARLAAAADPRLGTVLLAPLPIPGAELAGYAMRCADRWVSAWPSGTALGPDDADNAPWDEAASLLARLHTSPCPAGLARLAANPRRRLAPALAGLRAAPPGKARDAVLAAYEALPGWEAAATRGGARRRACVIHGDWHLGQLVRLPSGEWRLIDVDDLGVGEPVWDLARPAAWFAAGLLQPAVWTRFVDAYRAAGGPALPGSGDPWPDVDLPARTLVVEYAARALTASLAATQDARTPPRPAWIDTDGLDGVGQALVACCRQMIA